MLKRASFAFGLACWAAVATTADAAEVPPAMLSFIDGPAMDWVRDPQIAEAIIKQNAETAALTEPEIIALDDKWRAEVGAHATPTIDAVLHAPLSAFLTQQVEASGGQVTEVFVMDAKGLNVAASAVTSDYWQGDEAKYKNTFLKGPDAVFVDEVDFDESTQTYQGQVSFAITDPATGAVVGAITIGLDASAFF